MTAGQWAAGGGVDTDDLRVKNPKTARLSLSYYHPIGRQGVASEDICLKRALERLLMEGKPPGELHLLYLASSGQTIKILGVAGVTEGGRVVFFPGFTMPSVVGYVDYVRDDGRGHPAFNLHHVTLENDRTGHITGRGSDDQALHRSFGNLRPIPGGLNNWFGLSVQVPAQLEELAAHWDLTIDWYPSDITRMKGVLDCCVRGHHTVYTPCWASGSYLHIDFIVGKYGLPIPPDMPRWSLYPRKEPCVGASGGNRHEMCTAVTWIRLSTAKSDLAILASVHSGRLAHSPCIETTQSGPDCGRPLR